MSVRLVSVVVAALVVALAPATAGAAQRLQANGGAEFPLRSFVLTPDRPLTIDVARAVVTENGVPVHDARLESVGSGRRSSAVMLVIDASESMRGAPIRRAVEAARALAARRPDPQRLGVVLFNRKASVLLAPTTDAARIDEALSRVPPLQGGTRIFDAGAIAVRAVDRAAVASSAIVVLSDGNDTGSATSIPTLARLAADAGVRVFTVGLRSRKFDPSSLQALAAAGRGQYREAASAGELRGIFDLLGARFSGEYLLSYRSDAGPRTRIDVALTAPGLPGGATASYVTPARGSAVTVVGDDFWARDSAVAVVALALGLLVGIGSLALLGLRRRKRRDVRSRIAAFGMPVPERYESSFEGEHDGLLERYAWWHAFKEEVDIAQLERSPKRLAAIGVGGGIAFAGLVVLITGAPFFVVTAAAGPFLVRALVTKFADRVRLMFERQLVDTLQGCASALRAGHSIASALTEVSSDASEPTRREIGQALADERLGKPLDDALRDVSRRMRNRDVEQIALVSQLQRSTGANMAEVLDRVSETVRERQDLKRTIVSLTAQGRMARAILTALPPSLLLAVSMLNPDYVKPLFTEPVGIACLCLAAAMTIAGSLSIKKIVSIEV